MKRDLGWSALLGAVFAASPLSGAIDAHPRVSLVAGIVAAVGIFTIRRLRGRQAAQRHAAEPPLFQTKTAGPLVWVLLAGSLVTFLPTLVWLFWEYTDAIWRNAHGIFVPIVMAVLARSRLRRDECRAEESSPWGIPLLVGGGLLAAIDSGARSDYLSALGLVIALPGLSLLLLGARRTRAIAFPLALGLFLIPIPPRLPEPLFLHTATAALVEPLLEALGTPTPRHQTAFLLPVGSFGISANCSGIATLYASVFLAVILAQSHSWPRRAALLLSTWPITVGVNAVRTTFLIALCNRYGLEVLNSPIHGLTGIGTLWAVLILVFALADPLRFWRMLR